MKKAASAGVMFTETHEPYISMWPSERPVMDLRNHPRQTVVEAASWAEKVGGGRKRQDGPTRVNIDHSEVWLQLLWLVIAVLSHELVDGRF